MPGREARSFPAFPSSTGPSVPLIEDNQANRPYHPTLKVSPSPLPHPHHPQTPPWPPAALSQQRRSWILVSSPPASWLQTDHPSPPSSQHLSRPLEPLPKSEAPAPPGEHVSPSASPPRPRAGLALDPEPVDVCPGRPCSQKPGHTPAWPTLPSALPAPPVPHAQSLSRLLWLILPFLTSRALQGTALCAPQPSLLSLGSCSAPLLPSHPSAPLLPCPSPPAPLLC